MSFLAVPAWHRLWWNVYFCNYIPASNTDSLIEIEPGFVDKGDKTVQTAFNSSSEFRLLREEYTYGQVRGLQNVCEYLRCMEMKMDYDDFLARKGISPHKTHYSKYLDLSP